MTPPVASTPAIARSSTLLIGAVASAASLTSIQLTTPPVDVGRFVDWWELVGTPAATASIVRVVGLLLTAWLGTVAVAGLLAALTRSSSTQSLWQGLTPTSIQRSLIASTVVLAASAPAVGATAETQDDVPVLLDLGPTERGETEPTPPLLVDLGPVEASAEPPPAAPIDAPDVADLDFWTVQPGDHLWRIAEETLTDRGESTTEGSVAHYWRRLIRDNAAVIDDPDLIHPGLVLKLPT